MKAAYGAWQKHVETLFTDTKDVPLDPGDNIVREVPSYAADVATESTGGI